MIKQAHLDAYNNDVIYRTRNTREDDITLLTSLNDILPHGSGINGDWTYQIGNRGIIRAYNTYDAMDEYGGYCHYYDFVAYLRQDGTKFDCLNVKIFGRELNCCGWGLIDYLNDTIAICLDV